MTRWLYVGTFERAYHRDLVEAAVGVYAFGLHGGTLVPGPVTPAVRSGWLTPHPDGKTLYVAHEVTELDGAPGGGIGAYAVDRETGALRPLGRRRTGGNPCHAALSPGGSHLVVSTFHGGTVEVFEIGPDGALGDAVQVVRHHGSSIHPRRQRTPHPHAVVFDPTGRFVLVPDLGADRVVVHQWSAGRLLHRPELSVEVEPGSGPRRLVFGADGTRAYLVGEMSATIDVFAWDADGALTRLDRVSTVADGFTGLRSAAELLLDPTGRFAYVTNRSHGSSGPPPEPGEDSLAWFAVDADSGLLRPAGRVPSGGAIPRTMTFGPDGRLYVGHQGSSTILTFEIDAETGAATMIGSRTTPVPVCLQFLPVAPGRPADRAHHEIATR
ncbi:MAG: lactonase family protein [Nocardioides sp.]|uniref:lactonase family protein n=1 Tax=Nocardioides sp. TaxID=35761 RepID=UPI0039E64380